MTNELWYITHMTPLLYIHFLESTISTTTVYLARAEASCQGLAGLTGSICHYGITAGRNSVKDMMSFRPSPNPP